MSVLAIDDLLQLILQFGNFDDFIAFGQVCNRFHKLRCIDNIAILLNGGNAEHHNWLKSRKWKIARMKGFQEKSLQIVSHHLQVLYIQTWDPWGTHYEFPEKTWDPWGTHYEFPEKLVELSITFSTLPFKMDLTHCSNLVKLSLVTSENIDFVAYPEQLEYLDLHNSDVVDILSFTRLTRLHTLNVSNCENLCTLPILPNVRNFSIGGTTGITGFQLEYFLSEMTRAPSTDDRSCGTTLFGMKHLTSLDFSGSHRLNNIHLVLISEYKNLQSLNISNTQFPLDLFVISRMPNLQELNINGLAYYTSNASIRHLSYLPKLKKLYMARCFNVTTVSVLNRIKTLEYLDISECPMIEYANLPKHVQICRSQ
jgi:hypothetical protein